MFLLIQLWAGLLRQNGCLMGRINLNSGAVERVAREARRDALNDKGPKLKDYCKQESPVDTGFLRARTVYEEPTGEMREAWVNFLTYYAKFVILGTRRNVANDYPHRAIDRMRAGG